MSRRSRRSTGWPVSTVLAAVTVLSTVSMGLGTGLAQAAVSPPAAADRPVRVIVVTDAPSATARIDRAAAAEAQAGRHRGTVRRVYRSALSGYAATVPAGEVAGLRGEPGVRSVELDQLAHGAATQSPVPSWGLDRVDQTGLPLSGSYSYASAGAGVTAYIFDSGVRLTHQEFTGRIRTGPDYVDDDASSDDCYGHGTHVAGTTAGTSYGIAKRADVVAVRVLDCNNSGWYSDWIAAIDWIDADHQDGQPAVLNASLGGGYSAAINAAVSASIADGIVWVIAAMNNNDDACKYSPASVPEALTVGATDSADARASFSDFGSCVDLFAPGVGITSAGITDDSAVAPGWSGTSMATPHVTGAAARYLSEHPSASVAQVEQALLDNATAGTVTDARSPDRLLYLAPPAPEVTVPATPTVTATATTTNSATLTWAPPVDDGGSPITGYTASRNGTSSTGGGPWTVVTSPTTTSITFKNLLPGTSYTLTVAAKNTTGAGAAATAVVTTAAVAVPGAPTSVLATAAAGRVTLSWQPPEQPSAAVTGYRVRRYAAGASVPQATTTVGAAARSLTATGLVNGTSYRFDIAAIGAAGAGPVTSSGTVVPATVPTAPRIGAAVAGTPGGAVTATATWLRPVSTGGTALTGFVVTAVRLSAGGAVLSTTSSGLVPVTSTSWAMPLPRAGNYRFTVQAVNAVGRSPSSARSNLVAGR